MNGHVIAFTMDVVPKLIHEVLDSAGMQVDDIDIYAIHQANKQIVEMLVSKSNLPPEKVPTDVFSRYANATMNSVLTVVCDPFVMLKRGNVLMTSFGAGLSWAAAILNLSDSNNLGISFYTPQGSRPTPQERLDAWMKQFKGDNA